VTERGQAGLAEAFADIARQLQAEGTSETTRDRVTRAAVATVDGCDHAAISIIRRRGGIESVSATDDIPSRVDAIQYDVGEGPCLEAMSEHEAFAIDDLAADERWPAFSWRTVEETGVRSMLSFRLFVQGDTIGSLNLYSRCPAVFDEHARQCRVVIAGKTERHGAVTPEIRIRIASLGKPYDLGVQTRIEHRSEGAYRRFVSRSVAVKKECDPVGKRPDHTEMLRR